MNVAIIGYGVVGSGVHAILKDGKLGIFVKRVLDLRPIDGLEGILTDNIGDILGDPSIDCVVEAIGGMHPALSYVISALRAGKHAVTSNKELISHALAPLLEGAGLHSVQLRFSASVGGGVPWLHNLTRHKRGDTILSVQGIANGTTNYVLDAMAHGADFDVALREAQRLGYAEQDASADLDGIDLQRKCAISASLAFDAVVEPQGILTLGIGSVRKSDMDACRERGLTIKAMMFAERAGDGVAAYVEPTLLGPDALCAHTPTNHNCISLCAEHAGHLSFFGQGAGRYPTAENVVQDLLDIKSGLAFGAKSVVPMAIRNDLEKHPYYVRTSEEGLLQGRIAERWGEAVVTEMVSVAEMHEIARQIKEKDPTAFFAGLPG